MTVDTSLGLSIVLAGLWSGLLLAVISLLHPMYAAQDSGGFATDLQRFLPVARRSPTNWVAVNWVRAVLTWAAFGLFLAAAHLRAS
jgi:hypothetical protein